MWIYIAIFYWVVAAIVCAYTFSQIGGDWRYRLIAAIIFGIIWPIPVALAVLLVFEEILSTIRDIYGDNDD